MQTPNIDDLLANQGVIRIGGNGRDLRTGFKPDLTQMVGLGGQIQLYTPTHNSFDGPIDYSPTQASKNLVVDTYPKKPAKKVVLPRPSITQYSIDQNILNSYCFCPNSISIDGENIIDGKPKIGSKDITNSGGEVSLAKHHHLNTNDANLVKLGDFPYKVSLKKVDGIKKHMVVYTCLYTGCGKDFLRTWNILNHAHVHTNVKPYQCRVCGNGFTQRGNLNKHMKTHQKPQLVDRKRFQCEYCSCRYTERYNYRVSFIPCFKRFLSTVEAN